MKFFKESELACKCGCGLASLDVTLLSRLDKAREIAGIPFKINSGRRCVKHNESCGGSKNSSHLRGLAVDIACISDQTRWVIIRSLIQAGFTRIGVAKTFIHVDVDPTKPSAVWFY